MNAKVFISTLIIFLFSCSKDDELANAAETPHFIIKFEKGQATATEIEETKIFAEKIFEEYERYFGNDKLPQNKTVIHLDGDAFQGNGASPKIPFVDENGQIFLYRFATGYLGELPHEYVHVIRFYNGWSSDGFLEEGLAEALSSKLFPENIGFSLYGYSSTVAAGLWLNESNLIPLRELKDRHFDLNLKCLPQSYSLRADFFTFILEEYGKERFFEFIYAADAGTYEVYDRLFENTFDTLEELWLTNLQQRLNADPQVEPQITAYESKINELQFFICKDGVDF